MDANYDPKSDAEGAPSYASEDSELELLGWPRCLSAVPEDVLDMLDDSDSDSDAA